MAWIDDITTARDSAAANLKAVLASPRANYTVGNQTFDWADYVQMLTDTITRLNSVIEQSSPFEISSEGLT
jgi:hypothetical protein